MIRKQKSLRRVLAPDLYKLGLKLKRAKFRIDILETYPNKLANTAWYRYDISTESVLRALRQFKLRYGVWPTKLLFETSRTTQGRVHVEACMWHDVIADIT